MDYYKLMNNKVIVVGTGPSVHNYLDQLKDWSSHYDILSFSHSIPFLLENNIKVRYYSFLDVHAPGLHFNHLIESQVETVVFSPFLLKTYEFQQKYIGTSQLIDDKLENEKKELIYSNYVNNIN